MTNLGPSVIYRCSKALSTHRIMKIILNFEKMEIWWPTSRTKIREDLKLRHFLNSCTSLWPLLETLTKSYMSLIHCAIINPIFAIYRLKCCLYLSEISPHQYLTNILSNQSHILVIKFGENMTIRTSPLISKQSTFWIVDIWIFGAGALNKLLQKEYLIRALYFHLIEKGWG